MIPKDWSLKSDRFDLSTFLKIALQQEIAEEDSFIDFELSKMNEFYTELDLNRRESAYLIIREDTECKICHMQLSHSKIRVYPNGLAFHMKCAPNLNECPLTKQRFDVD